MLHLPGLWSLSLAQIGLLHYNNTVIQFNSIQFNSINIFGIALTHDTIQIWSTTSTIMKPITTVLPKSSMTIKHQNILLETEQEEFRAQLSSVYAVHVRMSIGIAVIIAIIYMYAQITSSLPTTQHSQSVLQFSHIKV